MNNQSAKSALNKIERKQIDEIIRQIKGPYKPFLKKIKLQDLVQILQEIWEEDEEY